MVSGNGPRQSPSRLLPLAIGPCVMDSGHRHPRATALSGGAEERPVGDRSGDQGLVRRADQRTRALPIYRRSSRLSQADDGYRVVLSSAQSARSTSAGRLAPEDNAPACKTAASSPMKATVSCGFTASSLLAQTDNLGATDTSSSARSKLGEAARAHVSPGLEPTAPGRSAPSRTTPAPIARS